MRNEIKQDKPKKISVVLVDRANYGRLKPVMQAIKQHPDLELSVICSGTMVLDRFGKPCNIVKEDGFEIQSEIFIELEGSTPTTMSKSVGFGIIEFSSEFSRIKPDIVLVIGDRYESLAAAIAASYMNICLAHIQGGEVSGSIDESARHCISKLAQFHFPSTNRSAQYLLKMGEHENTIFHVGCPSGDIALNLKKELPRNIFDLGVGTHISPQHPYLLVLYHPVTTQFDEQVEPVEEILSACDKIGKPVVWLWPNIDAGADKVSNIIRKYREQKRPNWLRLIKNFAPDDYLCVLRNASCAIGNSSSFVRDSSFFGTPVVLVGDRQHKREISSNVIRATCDQDVIYSNVIKQLEHGRYNVSNLYGDGEASQKIAHYLAEIRPYIQKQLNYD